MIKSQHDFIFNSIKNSGKKKDMAKKIKVVGGGHSNFSKKEKGEMREEKLRGEHSRGEHN